MYDKNNRSDNSSKVILRIYRLPYEDTETHKRTIEIIKALNSQNNIKASDLHSTDPKQVRLEQLLEKIGSGYKYFRKRSQEAKSARFNITMTNLALRYHVCKKNAPHEGVRGNVEELFEEDTKYDETLYFIPNIVSKILLPRNIKLDGITSSLKISFNMSAKG
ncbi:MAG TPA: hypothetical protein DDX84_10185 [Nitrospiraceae bacterium]|nr:MAG: hypothetical protein A2035_02680 [Nitrospirae bacterium GWA2_42_11]HBI24546.1 hypothetical protein [Nitrospiraceae bacterium]